MVYVLYISNQDVKLSLCSLQMSIFAPISANHQLLRETELQTPTQAKDISKQAFICV